MSTKDPLFIDKVHCPKCGSILVKANYMMTGTTPGVDHIDIYCGVCETFITHMNISPYEAEGNGKTKD